MDTGLKMKKGIIIIFSLCAAFSGSFLFEGPSFGGESADPLLALIQEKFSRLKSFTADFTQSFESRALGSRLEESGELYIKIPGQMRWNYLKPEQKIAICNGTDSLLYLREDHVVIKGSLAGSEGSQALLSLLTGMADLRKLFEGEILSKDHREIVAKLRMREENDQFDELIIAVDSRKMRILRIEVLDPLRNRMIYSFSHIRENVAIPHDLFQFSIPPGAQVKLE